MVNLSFTGITRDSKSKCRVVTIWTEYIDGKYFIHRSSGLIDGKKVISPDLKVTSGKVKRTLDEQITLEFNSLVKKYLDKGYKDIRDFDITELTVEKAEEVLPKIKTDQNGNLKPMLCKVLDKTDKKLTDKTWFASYKHDGLRMFLFYRDGEVHTSSRGGGNYDIAASYIREDEFINDLFRRNPTLILDGELYFHHPDWNLQRISSLGRKQVLEDDHRILKFYCYDIVMDAPFKTRKYFLDHIKYTVPDNSKLVIVEHFKVQGLEEIMKLHNQAIAEGYEGLVIRDPDKEYKCGARDNRMLKIKEMQDAEFRIKGIVEGLREEDMCFLMEMPDGTKFKAKPIGDKALKQYYREHLGEIVGKLGVIKFLYYSKGDHPVPTLPVFKCVRLDEDI